MRALSTLRTVNTVQRRLLGTVQSGTMTQIMRRLSEKDVSIEARLKDD